jgi:hypothetical protein
MCLYRAKLNKTITKTALILGYPILLVGGLIDIALNITLFSLVFFEKPQDWMLTQRMARYRKTDLGWRGKLAIWMCNNLLNFADPSGQHC